jgi:hypothetical protein
MYVRLGDILPINYQVAAAMTYFRT